MRHRPTRSAPGARLHSRRPLVAPLAALLAVATVLVLGGCGPLPSWAAGKERTGSPNIVFVLTDDLSPDLVEHMPNLVRMRSEGLSMLRYTVSDSLCCPSRASILTGRYPHNTLVRTNVEPSGGIGVFRRAGNTSRVYSRDFQRAGYRTGYLGKYMNGYEPRGGVPEPGWDEWAVVGGGAYDGFDYVLNENGRAVRYGTQPQDYLTDVLARKATAFVRRAARTSTPFVLQIAPTAPHSPFTPAPRHRGTRAGVPLPRTPAWNAEVANAPGWLSGQPAITAEEEAKFERSWQRRLESIRAVDEMLGSLRLTLAASGIADDTYVVFTSDNGLHMGEYRLTTGKRTAFDTDVRVPMIVTGPGVPSGRRTTVLGSNVDLAPTFRRLAGIRADTGADGEDLSAVWHGQQHTSSRQAVLIEHRQERFTLGDPDAQDLMSPDPPDYTAVRTADALYVRYITGEEEYYDTEADPYQLHNLAPSGVPPHLVRLHDALRTCVGARACAAAARDPVPQG